MSQCGGGNAEHSPVLVQAGNKTESVLSLRRKKPLTKLEKSEEEKNGVPDVRASPRSFHQSVKGRMVLRRQETLLHSNFSLSASCSSDCSTASFRSQASTGSIGRRSSRRKQGLPKGETILSKLEKIAPDSIVPSRPPGVSNAKRRCPWVTPNTDLCYRAFHDEEWGVPVHDDKKLFELLVLSGALAELTWPVILNKRKIFREVFLDFDPVGVSKLNEKKITAHGSIAGSLLTEPKLRAIVENAHQILKVIEEFGSFDKYCWSFVNQKPIISRFRYARQVPVKTPKADVISKDMVRRGFRSVGPTIIYTFMQVAGITNDHLISCHRFEECCRPSSIVGDKKDEPLKCDGKMEEIATFGASNVIELEGANIDLDLARVVEDLSVS